MTNENKAGNNIVKLAEKLNLQITGKNNLTEEEKKQISESVQERLNKELLASGGILRDYDNNEILYPISMDIINIVSNVIKVRRANL